MAGVGSALPLADDTERLAGAGARPDLAVGRPAGEFEGVLPAGDPGEEGAVSVSHKVIWLDIDDTPGVHGGGRVEIAEPLSGVGVDLVEVQISHHQSHRPHRRQRVTTEVPAVH
jgi:hypothetical protein